MSIAMSVPVPSAESRLRRRVPRAGCGVLSGVRRYLAVEKMTAAAELYLKGYASPRARRNILRKRELGAEGSVSRWPECSFVGRGVSVTPIASGERPVEHRRV